MKDLRPRPTPLVGLFFACVLMICCFSRKAQAQELYVFSEPASNMPAKALGLKYSGKFLKNMHSGKLEQRQMLQAQFGLTKKWMIHAATTISDMYSYPVTRWETANIYAKYRFLSMDQVHAHFRMAAFAEASYSRNQLLYDELTLEGDQSGMQVGIIATQLLQKLALSATVSTVQVLNGQRNDYDGCNRPYPFSALNYSLSAGYLLFPRKYTSYKQTNFNLYMEMLGSQTLDKKRYFVDLAPAVQFIFNSTTKLNFGYRFQLSGNMHRMAEEQFQLSVETVFLNKLTRRK
jgi:hypothetical protein